MTLRGTRLWIREQAALLVVIAGLAMAFLYLAIDPHRWARTTGLIASVVLLAAVLRALLPTDRVGALAVRSRFADTVTCLVLGGVLLGLDIRLHN